MMLFASIYISAIAQDCPPQNNGISTTEYEALIEEYCEDGNGISTDPDNLINNACPDLKNDFEWRIKQNPSVVSVNPEFYIVYDEFGAPKSVRNPFNDPGNHDYSHLDDNHNSNYNPEDGWELLKVDFGAESNFNTGWTQLPQDEPGLNPEQGGAKLPYMILYNKYSGTFRFFGSLLGQNDDYETVRIELRIPSESPGSGAAPINTYQSDLKATNLLSIQGDAVQPLDQETDENVLVVFAKATNTGSQFFWFDIPVAYDPCLCNIRSQMDITFKFVATANIDLNGTIDGAIKTESKNDGTPKGVKVATTVLAAGISTVLAVKTGGAVINFQAYSDLVKLFKDIPGLSTTQKDNLDQLSNYVDCGLKFAKVIKKDYKGVTASGTLTPAQKKAQYNAANSILDANTTFLSSLSNGCDKTDNGATTISAAVELSGTWTETIINGHTEIIIAMPGSNWTDKEMDREPYTLNGKTVASYPEYNERLGTFALLKTPSLDAKYLVSEKVESPLNRELEHQPTITELGGMAYRFGLTSDPIEIAFNPLLNLNLDKTIIQSRIVVQKMDGVTLQDGKGTFEMEIHKQTDQGGGSGMNPNCMWLDGVNIPNAGTYFFGDSKYPISTPFVPIEQIRDVEGVFTLKYNTGIFANHTELNNLVKENIFIQIRVLGESNDIGKDGTPNSFIQLLTFPLNLLYNKVESNLYPSLLALDPEFCFEMHNHLNNAGMQTISSIFKPSDIISIDPNGRVFDQDVIFNKNAVFVYDGLVEISANMFTTGGKKVTIYASQGFELLPGAEVGSNIELVIGLPFESTPTPPQTYSQVTTFCGDNNKYKAQEFSTSALREEKEEYEHRADMAREAIEKRNSQNLELKLYPNPTNNEFSIELDYALENLTVSVLDVNGKQVFTKSFSGEQSKVKLDASQLEAGIYFIDVRTLNGKIGRERLVKY
jgi:hypothetical protein